jgi:hypothetical protein
MKKNIYYIGETIFLLYFLITTCSVIIKNIEQVEVVKITCNSLIIIILLLLLHNRIRIFINK